MATPIEIKPSNDLELAIARLVDAPRSAIWRCWTEPELLKPWFCPKPWYVSHAEMDVRAGGNSVIQMRGPNGEQHDNPGVYLEAVRNERLVFTDAFTRAWEPAAKPFMVGIITLEDAGPGKTKYIARARHWTPEAVKQHMEMGFYEGWGVATDQLEAFARTLK